MCSLWLLPVSRNFSQLQTQSLKLVGKTNKLGAVIIVLRPVFAILCDGSARRSFIPLSFYVIFLVTPSSFGRLLSGHAGLKWFPSLGWSEQHVVFLFHATVSWHLNQLMSHIWNLLEIKDKQTNGTGVTGKF